MCDGRHIEGDHGGVFDDGLHSEQHLVASVQLAPGQMLTQLGT